MDPTLFVVILKIASNIQSEYCEKLQDPEEELVALETSN